MKGEKGTFDLVEKYKIRGGRGFNHTARWTQLWEEGPLSREQL